MPITPIVPAAAWRHRRPSVAGPLEYDRKVMNLDQFAGVNAGYVLELYERFRQDPESVDPATRQAFESWTPPSARSRRHAAGRRRNQYPEDRRRGQPGRVHPPLRPSGGAHRSARLRRRIGDPSLSPAAHGITDDDLRNLPASLVGGPVAESSAQCLRGHRKAAPHLLLDHRLRLRARVRPRRARVAPSRGRVGPLPAADGRRRAPRRSSTASRRSRSSSASCTARFPARHASPSKASTCWCRCSTRSSAAPPTTARAMRCSAWRTAAG